MPNLWIRIVKNNRIVKSEVAKIEGDVRTSLEEKLREMDMPSPLWLTKHEGEMDRFQLTSFQAGDFIEPVRFDKLEISVFDENDVKRVSKDPRNAF